MKKQLTKTLSIVMVFLICTFFISLSVSAAQPTLTAGTAQGKTGDTVTVPITISGSPGIVALRIFLEYNSDVLRLTEVTDGTIFSEGKSTFNDDLTANPYTMLWMDGTSQTNYTANGTLVNLTFEILDAATGSYPVKLTYDSDSTFNKDLDNITFAAKNGSVTVTDNDPDPIINIRDFTANRTIDYRTTITFTVNAIQNLVSGAEIHWFIDGKDSGVSENFTVKEAKKDFTVQAKYMKNGKVLAKTEVETVKVNSGFFARLRAFFQGLFRKLPVVVQ